MNPFRFVCALAMLAFAACTAPAPAAPQADATQAAQTRTSASPPLVAAARRQIGVTKHYDPAYVQLRYPGGDVPIDRGVCTDVIVRALRTHGLDLQQAIHQDMRAHFAAYPQHWGLTGPNRNIDHRRVPNQMRWFDRQGWSRPITARAGDYGPGDIVAWRLTGSGLLHIGLVSDRSTRSGVPLIIHNIGSGTQEEDLLFKHIIIGHYRPLLATNYRLGETKPFRTKETCHSERSEESACAPAFERTER